MLICVILAARDQYRVHTVERCFREPLTPATFFAKESTFSGSAADLLKLLAQSPFLTRSQSLKDLPREIPPRSHGISHQTSGISVGYPRNRAGVEVGYPIPWRWDRGGIPDVFPPLQKLSESHPRPDGQQNFVLHRDTHSPFPNWKVQGTSLCA